MRIFVFLCLLAPIIANQGEIDDNVTPYILEEPVEELLDCIRDILREGDQEWDLPPLDPYKITNHTIDLDDFGLKDFAGYLNFRNVLVEGIAGWEQEVKFDISFVPPGLNIKIRLLWPEITFNGHHDLDGHIMGHTIEGVGTMSGEIKNASLTFTAHATLIPTQKLSKGKIALPIQSAKMDFNNVNIDGVDIAPIIAHFVDNLEQTMADLEPVLTDLLNDTIFPEINKILAGSKLQKSIPIIGKCLP